MNRAPATPRRPPLWLAAAVCCVLLCSCGGEDKAGRARLPEVEVLELAPARVALSTELPARVSAFQRAEVRPQVGGILKERLFTEGSLVRQGQSLYKIDPATYEAEAESARAEVARAEARLHAARLTRDRRRSLVRANAVSRQAMEDADAAFLQADADLKAAQAALRMAEIRLVYTDVQAPIAGRIGKSSKTQGDLVTANQAEPLAVIQQLDPAYVDMTRSTRDLLRLRERYAAGRLERPDAHRTAVRLVLETGAAYPLEGTLQFSDITVDESTGMVLLRAVFPNPDRLLLPGMYVRAIVDEGVEAGALLVPQRAVRRDAKGGASVFVLGAGDCVEERPIAVADRVGGSWLVRSGLKAGDRVVLSGLSRLRHGARVRPLAGGRPAPSAPES